MSDRYSEERVQRIAWQIHKLADRHAVGDCGLNGWAACSCDTALRIRELSDVHSFMMGYRQGYAAAIADAAKGRAPNPSASSPQP